MAASSTADDHDLLVALVEAAANEYDLGNAVTGGDGKSGELEHFYLFHSLYLPNAFVARRHFIPFCDHLNPKLCLKPSQWDFSSATSLRKEANVMRKQASIISSIRFLFA